MIENKCGNCIFWEWVAQDYGTCKAIKVNGDIFAEIVIVADTDEHEISASLETHTDFYCNLWEWDKETE